MAERMKNRSTSMQRAFIVLAVVFAVIAKESASDDVGAGQPSVSNCLQPNGMKSFPLFLMGITPNCDDNGYLLPMQCFDHSKSCVCVKKNGLIVNKPSEGLKGCKCVVAKYKAQNSGMMGRFIPDCEEDGTYKKVQCNFSTGYCYCADPSTGQNTTVPVRQDVSCD